MTDCIHLLPPGTCATCNSPRTPIRRLIETTPESVTTARFFSICPRCDEPIDEGERIGLYQDEWIHLSHFEGGDL